MLDFLSRILIWLSAGLKMAPFKVLYVQSHRTPLSSSQKKPEKSKIIRPDLVVEIEEKVKVIQENLKLHNI